VAERLHSCPGGCGARIWRGVLACDPCWRRLPTEIRDKLNACWRERAARKPPFWRRQDAAYEREQVARALAWLRENPSCATGSREGEQQ